jgi:hypothetical protein
MTSAPSPTLVVWWWLVVAVGFEPVVGVVGVVGCVDIMLGSPGRHTRASGSAVQTVPLGQVSTSEAPQFSWQMPSTQVLPLAQAACVCHVVQPLGD